MYGRRDWLPATKTDTLVRFAFLGDSNAYGAGVAPDQTLAANVERQLNELLPAWPVECVNFGISGYNIWNSWTAFLQVPQVYAGIILTLCDNDADFFCRSYRCSFSQPYETRWNPDHPFGKAVVRCFDQIATFSHDLSIPVAVVFSSSFDSRGQKFICDIIQGLCLERNFCFLHTLSVYRERNMQREDLHVSSADMHPSAAAHNAVGRHLVRELRKSGWFDRFMAGSLSDAPGRISDAARIMIENDHYPADAALCWASNALSGKSTLANRTQALGKDTGYFAAADEVGAGIDAALHRWHKANRIRALAASTRIYWGDIAPSLFCGAEERMKLEEIAYAIECGSGKFILSHSLKDGAMVGESEPPQPLPLAGIEEICLAKLQSLRSGFENLAEFTSPSAFEFSLLDKTFQSDLNRIAFLLDRSIVECKAIHQALRRAESALLELRPELTDEEFACYSSLLTGVFRRTTSYFLPYITSWQNVLNDIGKRQYSSFTTVEITFDSGKAFSSGCQLISAVLEYEVPSRLQFFDAATFHANEKSITVKTHFPTFYAGRVHLRPFSSVGTTQPEFLPINISIYNGHGPCVRLAPHQFLSLKGGSLVSPPIFLY
jgi:hypothetical protein